MIRRIPKLAWLVLVASTVLLAAIVWLVSNYWGSGPSVKTNEHYILYVVGDEIIRHLNSKGQLPESMEEVEGRLRHRGDINGGDLYYQTISDDSFVLIIPGKNNTIDMSAGSDDIVYFWSDKDGWYLATIDPGVKPYGSFDWGIVKKHPISNSTTK